jgi:thiol-disulfide isomerase/thioredoxin
MKMMTPYPANFWRSAALPTLLGALFLVTAPRLPAQPQQQQQQQQPGAGEAEQPQISERKFQELLASETPGALEEGLAAIDTLSEENAMSMKLLYAFRSRDSDYITDLLQETPPALEESDFTDNLFFDSQDQYRSFVNLLRTSLALDEKNEERVRELAGKVVWQHPQHAGIVADMISEFKTQQRMAEMEVPLGTELKTSQGESTTLAKLVEGKKGLLLDFWASWCGPCMQLMPELVDKHRKLSDQGVVVAGMNTEGEAYKAETVRKERGITMPWLMEPEGSPYSQMLGIDSIPRMILLSPEGKVLFNGHPMDPRLEDALAELGAKLDQVPDGGQEQATGS